MSQDKPDNGRSSGQGRPGAASAASLGGSIRGVSTLILLTVNVVVAALMVASVIRFGLQPDPDVRAGAMWFTLTFTTAAALLMLVMALNATYLPLISRKQAPNVYLIMIAMGVTGVVVGLLTVGGAASPIAARLVLGAIALSFLTMQRTRHLRAQDALREGRPATPAPGAKTQPPRAKSRQRRGGRKR